jgi:hypothetical protein
MPMPSIANVICAVQQFANTALPILDGFGIVVPMENSERDGIAMWAPFTLIVINDGKNRVWKWKG